MIEAGDGFRFAPEAHERLGRIRLVSKDAFERDDALREWRWWAR